MDRDHVRLVLWTLDCRNPVAGSDGPATSGYRDCGLMPLGSGATPRLGAPETEEPYHGLHCGLCVVLNS